uniref:Aminotransferase-like plant mobile domain-containing protein n=1 Tax=Fagus sylvatica TaxID=28930 RepID=A0A2N9GG33_FAGSY
MHLGPRVNLQRVGKTLRAKAAVQEKNVQNLWLIFPRFLSVFARVFDLAPDVGFRRTWYRQKACKVSELWETELGAERYGSANRGRRSVFGPSEGIFPVKIPARPGKVLTIREFHTVHECVFFPTCPGSWIKFLRARKTLRASAATRSSRCRISVILVSLESLCYILSEAEATLLLKGFNLQTKLSPVGKNPRVNTAFQAGSVQAVSFCVSTPEKISGIFSVSVLAYGRRAVHLGLRASPLGIRTDIPGVEEDRTGSRNGDESAWVTTQVSKRPGRPPRPRNGGTTRSLETGDHRRCRIEVVAVGARCRCRSDRLAKGKAVAYEPESSPDTNDEYDAMEDVRTHADASISRNLQAELDAEAAGLASGYWLNNLLLGLISSSGWHSIASHCYYSGGRYASSYGPPRPSIIFGSSRECRRGGWSDFCQLLESARQEYRDFLAELGFAPSSASAMYTYGIPWIPPSEPVADFEALEILGIDDPAAIEGKKLPSLRIRYLRDLLRREIEEPPTELRYRQWVAYFIFSCFLGNDKSTVPTPIVGMFRDIDALRDYDWGALTYGFYIRGLRRFSRQETISFLGFWQFTIFWAFEHFPPFAPSRLPSAPDSVSVELSHLRVWIRSPRSWELLMGERTIQQMGGEAVVPVDPPQLMSIEGYIPRDPSDSYVAGVDAYPDLIWADVPYQEWFEQVSLGPLMSLHEVEGGRVMGRSAMDNHLFQSSGSTGKDGPYADGGDPDAGEMAQMQADLAQRQRDLDSRDAALATHAATIRRLEDQLLGVGIAPITGASSSGHGQTSSLPPPDLVSRDWFFDDPPSL